MIKCECSERIGSVINSYQLYEEIKMFFEEQVKEGRFSEVPVEKPYCNGFEWKADKWYKCICCGCLWEFKYPDFLAKGFVRKFADGIYHQKEIGKHEY